MSDKVQEQMKALAERDERLGRYAEAVRASTVAAGYLESTRIAQAVVAVADAEQEQLRRDIAGQTRSATKGWRNAEELRRRAEAAEESLGRLRALLATAPTMTHSNGYPVQAIPKADLLVILPKE